MQAGGAVAHEPPEPSSGAGTAEDDVRIQAVLDVLRGVPTAVAAERHGIDVALLARWRRAFVEAGTARITNRPQPDAAAERDRYLAALAHELRTPLTVALGWLDLTQGEELPETGRHGLAKAKQGLVRLTERLQDLELLAAASLGRLEVSPRPVRLAETVARLPEGEQDALGAALTAEQGETVMHVDPEHYWRILRDLWAAAGLDPAPTSREIEIQTRDPWLEVRVVGRGDPIPPRILQSLFDPFEHGVDDSAITIGLYLARALTVAHGGTLGLTQDDEHAVFWVRTPLHEVQGHANR